MSLLIQYISKPVQDPTPGHIFSPFTAPARIIQHNSYVPCGSLIGAEENLNSITWEKMAAPGAQPVVQLPINSQDNLNELWHSLMPHMPIHPHRHFTFYSFKPPPPPQSRYHRRNKSQGNGPNRLKWEGWEEKSWKLMPKVHFHSVFQSKWVKMNDGLEWAWESQSDRRERRIEI